MAYRYRRPLVDTLRHDLPLSFERNAKWGLGCQHLEQVTVRVAEIEAATAVAMIDLHVLSGTRPAAVGEALTADPVEDPVELRFADFEGIVVPLEAGPIVEIDRQGLVDPHPSEIPDPTLLFQATN